MRARSIFYYAVLLVGFALHAPPSVQADERLSPATEAHPVLEDRYPARRTHFPEGVVGLADVSYAVIPGFRPLKTGSLPRPRGNQQAAPAGDLCSRRRLAVRPYSPLGGLRGLAGCARLPGCKRLRRGFGGIPSISGEAHFPAAIQDVKSAIRYLRCALVRVRDRSGAGGDLGRFGGRTAGGTGGHQLRCRRLGAGPDSAASGRRPTNGTAFCFGLRAGADSLVRSLRLHHPGTPVSRGGWPRRRWRRLAAESLSRMRSSDCETVEKAASAASYVNSKDPPTLLIHGSDDHTVPTQQSRDFLRCCAPREFPRSSW